MKLLTRSNKSLNLKELSERDIDINDIAHSLSQQCRFGGHTREFYSVAQHSLLVASVVPRRLALCALLHDATEAYLVDLPSPIKLLIPDYKKLEDSIWQIIAVKYDLPLELPKEVITADKDVLESEMHFLMAKNPDFNLRPLSELPVLTSLMSPMEARVTFLAKFFELRREALTHGYTQSY